MLKLSIRKYGSLVGVSHTAVAKAIKAGYIVNGWDEDEKKILVDVANKEWGDMIKERNTGSDETIREGELKFPITKSFLSEQDNEPINAKISLGEARRRKEICNAELARIAALK